MNENTFTSLTADGLKLFDAAMSWAVNRNLVYTPPSQNVTIGTPQVGGGNITLSGSGGSPGGTYRILSSTDVTLPLAQWTEVGNGTFDGTGNFSSAIALPNDPSRYYVIVAP